MGQVWSKADCDGTNETGNQGGRGSAFAVTAQNPGADGVWDTADDLNAVLNSLPSEITIDWTPGPDPTDSLDRVRGFFSFHQQGSVFAFADGSTHFINDTIESRTYRELSTRAGGGVLGEY